MYKYLKFLTMSVLVFSLVQHSNSMNQNTITHNTENVSNTVNQNTINTNNNVEQNNINQQYDANGFFIYNPYSRNSPIPTIQDMLQFMKVKELDMDNYNVKKMF